MAGTFLGVWATVLTFLVLNCLMMGEDWIRSHLATTYVLSDWRLFEI